MSVFSHLELVSITKNLKLSLYFVTDNYHAAKLLRPLCSPSFSETLTHNVRNADLPSLFLRNLDMSCGAAALTTQVK